jgi:DNA uptake protein ComE-like DNA-binding protein
VAPNNTQFACAAVPIGDGRFWLIGRDPGENTSPTGPYFGLIDEGGKLNLNYVTTNTLSYLPNMTAEFAQYIVDWSSTNESDTDFMDYSMLGYYPKSAPFESVDELRLVYGANMDMLYGDDLNFNGVLDGNEKSVAGAGQINYGLLEYTTAWTREPNFFYYQGTVSNKIYINDLASYQSPTGQVYELLLAANISTSVIPTLTNGVPYTNLLAFAATCYTVMNSADFNKIYNYVSTYDTNTSYIFGRVNINTASSDVLTALFDGLPQINGDENTASSAAQTLISYRKQNPSNIDTLMWVVDALGTTSPIITALEEGDFITTRSYQFTADIGAVGAFGRGYRRVKFVFDTTGGTPIIVYRQDLSSLGWALGDTARQDLLANNKTPQ